MIKNQKEDFQKEEKRNELSEEELNKVTGGEGEQLDLANALKKSVQKGSKLASEADIDSAETLTPKTMFI